MPNGTYPNKLIENKYESVLLSDLQESDFLTIDESLTNNAGDTVEIVTRSVDGFVEDVEMGAGNTTDITVTSTVAPYKVKTKQGRFKYYDEEVHRDPMTIDAGIKGMAEQARSAWLYEAILEYDKAFSNQIESSSISFDNFADAVAMFGEKDADLRALVNPATVATLRKNLKEDLKYSEDFARNGYIGLVCGVPIMRTNAVQAGEVIICQKDAVTLFVKKNNEVEQERDANTRENRVYTRKVAVVALTNESHVARIAAAQETATTVNAPSSGSKTITGDCSTNANVYAYVNNVLVGHAVAVNKSYTITVEEPLKTGDSVRVVGHRGGEVAGQDSKTVA